MKKYRALISVSNKVGIVEFAQRLAKLNFEIVSTGGTAKVLREGGVAVTDVAEITGFPEMMDGRVKTLHPKIHGGILARSNYAKDMEEMAQYGIKRFHLVVVDLYPFKQVVAKPETTFRDAMENIDIGGPTMLRAAAKNYMEIIVVCDPADRDWVIQALENKKDLPLNNRLSLEQSLELAKKVFATMADYDGAINNFLGRSTGKPADFLLLEKGHELAYAENRCQNPAFIFSGGGNNPLAVSKFQVMAGNPSYIAMADASQLVSIMCLMTETFRRTYGKVPFIAIAGKHGGPCGVGVSWVSEDEALIKALFGDSAAVMGGELITNFPITDELGLTVYDSDPTKIGRDHWGLDEILAPKISPATIELLGKKAKRRLLVNPALTDPPFPQEEWTYREQHGGDWLKQRLPKFVLSPDQIISWTGRPLQKLHDELIDDLIIAFACCWRATSNTVALAKSRQLIGLGCGQQDRIACVRLCLDRANRAGHDTAGSVFASDAFFPYASAPDETIDLEPAMQFYQDDLRLMLALATNKREKLIALTQFAHVISQCDRREGPELLRDAGCIGGVVPADGKKLAEVQEFFRQAGMSVAFVAPENRGFARH